MRSHRGLTIGELAGQSGVNLETIRFYERIGLMPEPDRTEGGHRLYAEPQVRRLAFIRRGRELGLRPRFVCNDHSGATRDTHLPKVNYT